MLIGYEERKKDFLTLIEAGTLAHGYIFFGEPQIGKASFAMSLAAYLETGSFEKPLSPLTEATLVSPDEKGTIGIDAARDIKYFLGQKSHPAKTRVVVIDEATHLTAQAQNALLKIAEEPPRNSLIILVSRSLDALLPTLRSRFQAIYFPRFTTGNVVKAVVDVTGLDKVKAEKLAAISFGRPGRAIELASEGPARDIYREVVSFLGRGKTRREIADSLAANPEGIEPFFTNLIAELAKDVIKNYDALRLSTTRLVALSEYNVNKRLQLESALWNI